MTGSLSVGRRSHTATLLSDGRVLVAGGSDGRSGVLASAELYHPPTQNWTLTGSLTTARTGHTAISLPSGMVLVAGGANKDSVSLSSAELYEPATTPFTQVIGRGSIDGRGDEADFTVRATQSGEQLSGSLAFSDPAAGVSIARAKVRTLTFNGNTADLTGVARLDDGTRVTFSVSVSDVSSDGSSDTFTLSLSNGYSAGGTLTSGDIQIQ